MNGQVSFQFWHVNAAPASGQIPFDAAHHDSVAANVDDFDVIPLVHENSVRYDIDIVLAETSFAMGERSVPVV